MKKYLVFLYIYLFISSFSQAQPAIIQHPKMISLAETMPHSGILRQTQTGFLYLDVSDNYIHKLQPIIKEKNLAKPPYFSKGGVGAHITIMDAQEGQQLKIQEIGKRIFFQIERLYSAPVNWKKQKVDMVYFLSVKCPELEKIRKKYNLSPLHSGHDFHITIAVRKTNQ